MGHFLKPRRAFSFVCLFLFFFLNQLTYFTLYGCFVYMYACVPHACLVPRDKKEELDHLGQQLQMAVTHCINAGN